MESARKRLAMALVAATAVAGAVGVAPVSGAAAASQDGAGRASSAARGAEADALRTDFLHRRVDDVNLPVQDRIDAQLALTPGAVQISATEVAVRGGEAIITFPAQGSMKAGPSSPAALRLQLAKAGADVRRTDGGIEDEPLPARNTHGCPTQKVGPDWYCFYQDWHFEGRRVQWVDPHCGYDPRIWIWFRDVGFPEQASSWYNAGGLNIAVYNEYWNDQGTQFELLWTMKDHTGSSWVGDYANDKADAFQAC